MTFSWTMLVASTSSINIYQPPDRAPQQPDDATRLSDLQEESKTPPRPPWADWSVPPSRPPSFFLTARLATRVGSLVTWIA